MSFDGSKRYNNTTFVRIAGRVAYGGLGLNEAGDLYYLLKIGRGSSAKILTIAAGDVAARGVAFFERLAKAGAPLLKAESRNKLLAALEEYAKDKPSFAVVSRPGWPAGFDTFVHPSGVIGDSEGGVQFSPSEKRSPYYEKFRPRGTAKRWAIGPGALHCGNTLAITLANVALASPLLLPMEEGNFAVCVVGRPASGKSSWLVAASSQWGAHPNAQKAKQLGSAETANHTLNSLEELFATHNDVGVVLDDFRSLRGAGTPVDVIEQLAFALSDGDERGRQTSPAAPERSRVVLLTSANESIQAKAAGTHSKVDRAILDRLIEIPLPLDHTSVEEMHGYRSLDQFCDKLRSGSVKSAGGPGLLFARKLHARLVDDRDGCVSYLRARQRAFVRKNENSGASERVLRRFGILYAAGCLAIQFRLHPWGRYELAHALAKSLAGHVRLTVTQAPGSQAASNADADRLLGFLRDWFVRQRPRMRNVSIDPVHQVSAPKDTASAYLHEHKKHGHEVLLRDEAFARLIETVCSPAEAKRLLLAEGIITPDQERISVKRTIGVKSNGKPWRTNVIALKRGAIDAAWAETPEVGDKPCP
ncbi:MAG: DUF927 domain-containing protein [Bosea sp. (in: a-proteobacteria)]|uniref:DUF927 domain-containing protein n=1 Tax=Bosea sp. (in: a-proteobacteria) TaxID=1871050 RepID=UPI00273761A6|nr:DUF927 domain-containing protein [Bosea sp. (in: a-proteobacteria)]MDP3603825.1 DUF927 domain-containing protein [Bosea sp. (in: a-proteobacteria)]